MAGSETEVVAGDGTPLHVRQMGEGPAVMLIPGLGGVGAFWDPVAALLAGRFRVVVADHRGTGRSGRPADGYTIEQLAEDAEAIAARLGLGTFVAVGHSTGAAIVRTLLQRRRCGVRGAVLSAGVSVPDAHFALLFRTRLAILEAAGPAVGAQLAHLLGYDGAWLREHAGEVWAAAAATAAQEDAAIGAARIRMLLAYEGADDWGAIRVPVLVLGSEADVIHPPYHQRALAAGIAGAELRLFEGGHFFPRVQPGPVAAAIGAFIDGLEEA